jgi:calcineurin-like phosphoesterase family protein
MQLNISDKPLRGKEIWLWSDPHLWHGADDGSTGIIKMGKRPFSSLAQMQQSMIENMLEHMPDNAIIVCNGDLCMGKNDKLTEFLALCKWPIICIRGNHDPDLRVMTLMKPDGTLEHRDQTYYLNKPLLFPDNWKVWYVDKLCLRGLVYKARSGMTVSRINFDHYPAEEWHGCEKSGILFHGHVHHNDPADRMQGRLNICADVVADRHRDALTALGADLADPVYQYMQQRCYAPYPIDYFITALELDRERVTRRPSDRWPNGGVIFGEREDES